MEDFEDNVRTTFPTFGNGFWFYYNLSFVHSVPQTQRGIKDFIIFLSETTLLKIKNQPQQDLLLCEAVRKSITNLCRAETFEKKLRMVKVKKIIKHNADAHNLGRRGHRFKHFPDEVNFFDSKLHINKVWLGDQIPQDKQVDTNAVKGDLKALSSVNYYRSHKLGLKL